jgi:hypothetical protein
MKTLILSCFLILGLAAQNYSKPINDIFSIKDPVLVEEVYINDIPFNTNDIAIASILDGDVLKLDEEAYVDDIPFDTEAIAVKYVPNLKVKSSDESYIDDLPFNTEKVFYEKLAERLTKQYKDETESNDIPDVSDNTFCCYKINILTYPILKITKNNRPISYVLITYPPFFEHLVIKVPHTKGLLVLSFSFSFEF